MATRHQVRQSVVSLLYAKEMGSEMDEFTHEFLEERKIRNEQKNFTLTLFNGILSNLEQIDELLNSYLGKWKIGEIGAVERAILRLGAWELRFSDTDKAVVINEAILLASELGSDSAVKFINGVLDAIKKGFKNGSENRGSADRGGSKKHGGGESDGEKSQIYGEKSSQKAEI